MSRLTASGIASLDGGRIHVDVDVAAGSITALVGPNGCGKSTTLELLIGLRRLGTGTIVIDGVTVDDGSDVAPPRSRGLGWVPQIPSLLPRRPPLDQVARFARPDVAVLADDDGTRILETLGIDPRDHRGPSGLSVGERQRVAVARALAASSVVVLDEPTSAQDADGGQRIRSALRRLAAAGGSALVVAHRPEDAHLLADRVIVLERDGDETRPVQSGTPAELAADPATPYVADAVGATVLHGEVGDDHVLRGDWGALRVSDGVATGVASVVVRPGAVAVHRQQPEGASPRNVLPGVVEELRDRAAGVTVAVASSPPLVAALTHEAANSLDLRPGTEVWVSVKAGDLLVLGAGGEPRSGDPR